MFVIRKDKYVLSIKMVLEGNLYKNIESVLCLGISLKYTVLK